MADLLDEVTIYLAAEGVGTFGTDLFIGYEPASPVNVVTLYPTGGRAPDALSGREYHKVQVRIRNETYPGGWAKAREIQNLLHVQEDFLDTLRGRCYALQSSPHFIGHGENGEFLFTLNFNWYLTTTS